MTPDRLPRDLFPGGVFVAWDDAMAPVSGLHPEEEPAVAKAVAKRRMEYAAGRRAARVALAACGAAPTAIINGEDRAPAWPAGYVGSISHSGNYALAVCAKVGEIRAVGVDIEVPRTIEEGVWERVLTPRESAVRATLARPDEFALTVFSAKEAFYKAQYTLTRTFIDFEGAELTLDRAGEREGRFAVKVLVPLPVALPTRYEGRFFVKDDYVLTTFAYLV